MKLTQKGLAVLMLISILGTVTLNYKLNAQSEGQEPPREAPFTITVEPENVTVKTGEDIILIISIEAEEGFNSQVDLQLEVSFVGYNITMNMFPLNPSFPRMQEATIEVPSRASAGVVTGILKATSEGFVVINKVQVTLVDETTSSTADTWGELAEQEQELLEEEAGILSLILRRMEEFIDKIIEYLTNLSRSFRKLMEAGTPK